MKLAPGEASPVHRHFGDDVMAYVDPLDAEILRDDETSHARYERGYVAYFPVSSSGSELQRLSNVGGETHTHFVIELLGQNKLAPQSSNGREGAA